MEEVWRREQLSSAIFLWTLHWSSASLLEEALSLLAKRLFKKFMVGVKEVYIIKKCLCFK
jgi:hypothetical protein